MSDLPPGFVLDQSASSQAGSPALPDGFVMDGGAPAAPQPHKFGLGDTWPAQLAKSIYSGVTLPGDVYSGKTQVDPSNPAFIGRTLDLASVGTPMAPKVAPSLTAPVAAALPTAEELKAAASSGYDAARNLGVEIKPSSVANAAQTLAANLEQDGINAKLAPKTFSIISDLAKPPPGSVATIANLETARRTLGNAAKDFLNPTEKLAASRAIEHFDDYLGGLPQADILAGDAAQASKVLQEARGNYAAAKRSEQINGQVDIAEGNAAAANSGQNIGNSVRQRFNSILKSPKQSNGFTADEIAQMERIRAGTPVGNAARFAGNLLGGGGGLGSIASAAVGAGSFGPMGAVAPAIGFGLKKFSDASVMRQVRKLDEMTRARSPLGQQSRLPSTVLTPAERFRRELALRAFLASVANRNGQ
jgi:hypothetical protein